MVKRSILITGCSSGIGFEAAKTLSDRGWRVFATARSEKDVTELAHASFETLQLDVNDSESIRRVVAEVLDRTGGTLDALFNIQYEKQMERLTKIGRRGTVHPAGLGGSDEDCPRPGIEPASCSVPGHRSGDPVLVCQTILACSWNGLAFAKGIGGMKVVNHNLCEQCIQAACGTVPSREVADTGSCGACGAQREVFDLELVHFYFQLGLSPKMIWRRLPRLRNNHLAADNSLDLSWTDIATRLSKIMVVRDSF